MLSLEDLGFQGKPKDSTESMVSALRRVAERLMAQTIRARTDKFDLFIFFRQLYDVYYDYKPHDHGDPLLLASNNYELR